MRVDGVTACVGGTIVAQCTPGAPANDANCDGIDNDCNGVADDKWPFSCSTCEPVVVTASMGADGEASFTGADSLVLPLHVPTVSGVASGTLSISYGDATCSYVADGPDHYVFESCSDGLTAGDAFEAQSVHVHLQAAPSGNAPVVATSFETCGGAYGLPGKLLTPSDLEYGMNSQLGIVTGRRHLIVMLQAGSTRRDLAGLLARVDGRIVGSLP